jgi:hypothetical protein
MLSETRLVPANPDSLIFYALSPANEIGSQGVLIHFQEYYQIPHLSILLIA